MKKLEISGLLSGLEKRRKSRNTAVINYKTVGLIGLCSGAGTTQLGVMLANYFSNVSESDTFIISSMLQLRAFANLYSGFIIWDRIILYL